MSVTQFIAVIGTLASLGAALGTLILIQTTAVLTVGLACARALRRHGAAVQSAWYRMILAATILTPCASALTGPAVAHVHIPVPVSYSRLPPARAKIVEPAPTADPPSPKAAEREMTDAVPPEWPAKAVRGADLSPAAATQSIVHENEPAQGEREPSTRPSWLTVTAVTLCTAWLLISVILAGRLIGSILGAMRLIRAAFDAEPQLAAHCGLLARNLGVGPPGVRRSPFVSSACVFGWRRPVIVLPESDAGIGDDVLIHELAHVARRDCFWKLLAECVVALFWFQPLLWRLKSRMQECAEEVCDDYAVQFGADRCDYADRLTRIAERFLTPATQVGIGIVSYRSSLGRRVSRILDSTRRLQTHVGRKTITAMLCGGIAVVLGVSLFDFDRPPTRASGADEKPGTPTSAASSKLLPAREENGDVVTIRGQVRKPDGQPAVGAAITVIRPHSFNRSTEWRPISTVTAGPAGRFELVYRKSQCADPADEPDLWKDAIIEIKSDGLALRWMYWHQIDAAKPLAINLVPDFPIRGRVIDLQGQPVAGVAVCVLQIGEWSEGNLDSWLQQIKAGATRWTPAAGRQRLLAPPHDRSDPWAVTDREGRFVLRGFPGGCLLTLSLRGETIEYNRLAIVTKNMETFAREPNDYEGWMDHVYGADFTYPTAPGRPVAGTIRDATTGKALAGVRVEISQFTNRRMPVGWDPQVLTDANGQYRLLGLPKEKGIELFLTPNKEQPYLPRELAVPGSTDFEPATLDVQLHRGLWITGRATDKITGKGVAARIYYFPFLDNPFTRKLPEFHGKSMDGNENQYWTRPDGAFRLVGLPGRAIVGAWAPHDSNHYRRGVGASQIQGIDKSGFFPTYSTVFPPGTKWPDVVKEIKPREGAEAVECDLVFDPGATIRISLVDRNGKPVEGSTVHGRAPGGPGRTEPSTFDMVGLAPGEKRPLLIYHKQLHVGKFELLEFTDKTPRTMTITLDPCATVTGRIVDQIGNPIKATVSALPRPIADFWPEVAPIDNQPDGTFQYAVPVGCQYGLRVDALKFRTDFFKDCSVEPGKNIDVGEIKLRPRRRR